MSRLLIKHAHLIIDGYRQFIDGAILINDKSIEDVYPHTNKVDINEESIDIEGKIVMPSFVSKKVFEDNQDIIDPLNTFNTNKKIMLGNTKAYQKDININYDGIYNLFVDMTPLDYKNKGLVNEAFTSNKYIEVDGNLDKDLLNVVYRQIRKDKIIIFDNYIKGIKSFKECGCDLNEILLFTSLNAYTLFNMDNKYGSLIKGKSSNLVILDDNLNIVKEISHV